MSERIEINGQVHVVPEPLAGYITALREKCEELQKDSRLLGTKYTEQLDQLRELNNESVENNHKIAELQRQLDASSEAKTLAFNNGFESGKLAEQQRQLDEAAKQSAALRWTESMAFEFGYNDLIGKELYRYPPNLPALIEKAKREERERLDFVMDNDAFLLRKIGDSGAVTFQLCNQDEDEDFHVLSGEDEFFPTEREAIDAAIRARTTGIEEGKTCG